MLKHLLITRPIGKGNELVSNLEAAGFKVSHTPVLKLNYLTPSSAELTVLDEADVIIFISQDAVKGLAAVTSTLPEHPHYICVGTSTASALQTHFKCKSTVPEQQDTEGMLALAALSEVAEKRIVIVKGTGGRPDLAKTLKARHALLTQLEVYERLPAASSPDEWLDHWKRSQIDGIVITSNAAVDAIFNTQQETYLAWLTASTFFVVSERIAEYLKATRHVTGVICVTNGAQDEHVFKAILAARQTLSTKAQVSDDVISELSPTSDGVALTSDVQRQEQIKADAAQDAVVNSKEAAAEQPKAVEETAKIDLAPNTAESNTLNNQEATMSVPSQDSTPVTTSTSAPISKVGVLALLVSLLGLGASAGIVWQGQQTVASLQSEVNSAQSNNAALLQRLEQQTQALLASKDALSVMANKLDATTQTQQQELYNALEQMKASTAKPDQTFAKGEVAYLSQLLTFKALVEQDWETSLLLLSRIDRLAIHFPEPHVLSAAVAQDIATLRGQQNPPIDAVYVSLLGLQQQAATISLRMRILPDEKPVESAELSESAEDWLSNLKRSWDKFAEEFIRIRQREAITAAPLLSESEQQMLRTMLDAYFAQAQSAVVKQQVTVYQAALAAAEAHIMSHYDTEDGAVKGLLLELARLAEIDIAKPKSVTLVTPELVGGIGL
jgi:uroporphyrinogen III methyltransferase/synthase